MLVARDFKRQLDGKFRKLFFYAVDKHPFFADIDHLIDKVQTLTESGDFVLTVTIDGGNTSIPPP